jgi:peptidoglycan hydrolase CwlO-like protein
MEITAALIKNVNSALLDLRRWLRFKSYYDDPIESTVENMLSSVLIMADYFEKRGVISPDDMIGEANRTTEDISAKLNEQMAKLERTVNLIDSQITAIQKKNKKVRDENERMRREIERIKV